MSIKIKQSGMQYLLLLFDVHILLFLIYSRMLLCWTEFKYAT
jgi:hypothetical protein